MPEFYDVIAVDDVVPETAAVLEVNGRDIALVFTGGRYFALQNECTADGFPMGEGDLVGDNILECPGDAASFNVETGEPLAGPTDEPLETYEVQVVDGMIRVAVE